jgi:hypothetical protein
MIITDLLSLGALMSYGALEPCIIDGCKMRANDYVVIADDFYELCDYHYSNYLTLWHARREIARAAEDEGRMLELVAIAQVA